MGEPISSSILCPHQPAPARFWEHLRRKTRRTHLTLSWLSGLSPGRFLQERFWGPEPASLLSCCPCASCPGRPRGLEDRICFSLAELQGVSPGHRAHSTLSSPYLLSQRSSVRPFGTKYSCCREGHEPGTGISCKGCRCEEGTAPSSGTQKCKITWYNR